MRHPQIAKFLLVMGLGLFTVTGAMAADDRWTLTASEWSRPRSGAAVLEMTPVADAVRTWRAAFEENREARLLLMHPGGEQGALWAAELRDWLIALGVPPTSLELIAGGQAPDQLEIRLRKRSS